MCCTRIAETTGRKNRKKIRHLGTIAQVCRAVSSQGTYRQSEKVVKQQYLLQMSPQYGELRPDIGPGVWGTPANFNGFRVLAALLHSPLVVGVSQTLRR